MDGQTKIYKDTKEDKNLEQGLQVSLVTQNWSEKSHDEVRFDARTRVVSTGEVGDRSVMSQYVMGSDIANGPAVA